MSRQVGLGRGLSALIPAHAPGQSGLRTVALSDIVPNPRQPRGTFDRGALEELAHSLREVGLLQPILVRPRDDGRYELIAGERRFRAAKLAGLDAVPAVVRLTEDAQLLTEALVENLHRADLNPLEEAAAYQQLLDDFELTHDTLAARLGKSRSTVTNTLRLLGLPYAVQQRLLEGVLSAGHARALLGLPDAGGQERLASRIVADGLSVRATEELVRRAVQTDPDDALDELAGAARARARSPYEHLQSKLADALGTRVRIAGSPRKGRVVIEYSGAEDLQRLLDVIGRGTGEDLTSG